MSLLDTASFLLTPNAYKEGKLYSVIPSNGNGDFTATRATTATRVNSAGLVDLVPYNLVQYSEMFADAAWGKVNSTISANTTTAPDGTLTADTLIENILNAAHLVGQNISASGTSFTLSIYAKAKERSKILLFLAGASSKGYGFDLANGTMSAITGVTAADSFSITNVGNGWYRCTIVVNTTSITRVEIYPLQSFSNYVYAGDGTSGVFIWGAQLVEGTSARDYLRTETRLNIPRVDYSLGGCPNILLEPQRTNLALQSSSFDNASWTKLNGSITANTTTSPSGIVDADKIVEDATNNFHGVLQAVTTTSGVTCNVSFYAKASERGYIQWNNQVNNEFANFDLISGVIGTSSGVTNHQIQSVGNGWYRCSLNFVPTVTGTAGFFRLVIVTSASASRLQNYAGDGTSGLFLWGTQFEAGAYATSYIPTTTASVTRNADSITRNNIFTNGLITAAGGTWFVELRNNVAVIRDGGANELYIGEDASGAVAAGKQAIAIRNGGGGAVPMSLNYWNGSAFAENYLINSLNPKIAVKFTATTYDVFVNGVKVLSARPISWTLSNVQFLNKLLGTTQFLNQMALFPTPLTDAQCIALTQ